MMEHNQLPGALELAYMGDAVYELYARRLTLGHRGHMKELHRETVARVNAHAQAEALARLEGRLSETEEGVVRRARNCHQTPPKNADPGDYHRATALEALLGYLYLTGQRERLEELVGAALGADGREESEEA